MKAYPSAPLYMASAFFASAQIGTEDYWDVISRVVSQYPALDSQGISAYTFIAPSFISTALHLTSAVDGFQGVFFVQGLHPENTSQSLEASINKLFDDAMASYSPSRFIKSVTTTTFSDFWDFYSTSNGPLDAGHDQYLGSRLLDENALTQNLTSLKEAYKTASPPGSVTSVYLVSGKGVHNAKPRGGSNAVNPAWRKAYVHSSK